MPLYEYKCDACGHRFELIQRFADKPAETCSHCGSGPVHKLLSSPAIQFKGSGWYITDYARKSDQKEAGKSDSAAASDAGAKEKGAKEKGAKTKGDAADKSGGSTEKKTATAGSSPSTKD